MLLSGVRVMSNGSIKPTGAPAKRRRARTKDLTDLALEKAQTSVLSRLRRWHAWNSKFHLLAKFMKIHPGVPVPVSLDSVSFPKLGPWVIEQRNALRADKNRLDREREAATAALADPASDAATVSSAKQTLAKLEAAAAKHYDYAVAARRDGGSEHHQPGIPHIEKQNGPGTAARRVARLDSINFDWGETRLSRWNRKFDLLCKYHQEHGDVLVPADLNTEEYPHLGKWVVAQRRAYRETVQTRNKRRAVIAAATAAAAAAAAGGPPLSSSSSGSAGAAGGGGAKESQKRHLTQFQIEKLDGLGFTWVTTSIRLARWTKHFHLLRAYAAEYGTTNVPLVFDTVKYPKLGKWVDQQRKAYRKGPVEVPVPAPSVAAAAEGTASQAARDAAAVAAATNNVPYNRITTAQVDKLQGIGFDWSADGGAELGGGGGAGAAAAGAPPPAAAAADIHARKRARVLGSSVVTATAVQDGAGTLATATTVAGMAPAASDAEAAAAAAPARATGAGHAVVAVPAIAATPVLAYTGAGPGGAAYTRPGNNKP